MNPGPEEIRVAVLTLGCPKNQVDSEILMGYLQRGGISVVEDLEEATHVIVNTCSFISPAVQESLGEIQELLERKAKGELRYVGVTGCLIERFRERLPPILKHVDAVFGFDEFPQVLVYLRTGQKRAPSRPPRFLGDHRTPRISPRGLSYRYIKVSEGCDKACSFCVIPKIRGSHRSRPIEDVVTEVREALEEGVKEIILVSQDIGMYGYDLYGPGEHWIRLLRTLDHLPGKFWLRFLYLHPFHVTEGAVAFLKDAEHLVPYLEVPIQHISDRILRLMNRSGGQRAVVHAMEQIRKHLPTWYLRTEVIVGFPTETNEEFTELLNFLQDVGFERIGVFPFYAEPEAPASRLPGILSPEVVEDRVTVAEQVAYELVADAQRRLLGHPLEILVEHQEDGVWLGRSPYDAPDVDLRVQIPAAEPVPQGTWLLGKVQNVLENLDLEVHPDESL